MNLQSDICVSVLLPVYNVKPYIKESVESILSQTWKNLELIIIDDVSTDGTQTVIREFNDKRIVFIQKDKNSGLSESLNRGIEIAKGSYIARMDADDISLPERLEKQVAFLEKHKEVDVCGTEIEIMGSSEKFAGDISKHEEIIASLLISAPIAHPTVMFRKSFLADNSIRYDSSFEPAEDFELWVRVAGITRFAILPDALLRYRKHEDQVSTKRNSLQQRKLKELRIKLLSYLTGVLNGHEYEYAETLFGLKMAKNTPEIKKMFIWGDSLIRLNAERNFFDNDLLKKYILKLKRQSARNYFLGRSKYKITDITDFLQAPKIVRKEMNFNDTARYFLKSVLFWKRREG